MVGCKFQPNQIVVFIKPKHDPEAAFPMKDGEKALFLGEIDNMPGFCTVATRTGQIVWPLSVGYLRELTP